MLLGLAERTATAALSFADYLLALLACGNSVAVAFEHFLGDPADDAVRVFRTVKLLSKLRFELCDVRHEIVRWLVRFDLCACGREPLRTLDAPSVVKR